MQRSAPGLPDLRPLGRADLPSDTVALARFLIGATLIHDVDGACLAGRIVETESYLVGDAASHAFRGETRRNRSMFLERGHAYVYLAYGTWPALNVSSEAPGIGAGVLIRALQPLEGIEAMLRHRGTELIRDLARGPGRLTKAMRVTLADDGVDLCAAGALRLAEPVGPPAEIGTSVRIGITKEADRPLRFFERGSPFLSGPRRLSAA